MLLTFFYNLQKRVCRYLVARLHAKSLLFPVYWKKLPKVPTVSNFPSKSFVISISEVFFFDKSLFGWLYNVFLFNLVYLSWSWTLKTNWQVWRSGCVWWLKKGTVWKRRCKPFWAKQRAPSSEMWKGPLGDPSSQPGIVTRLAFRHCH